MITFEDKFKVIFGSNKDTAKSLYDKLQKTGIRSPVVENVKNTITTINPDIYKIKETYPTRQIQPRMPGEIPAAPISIPERQSILQRIGKYVLPQPEVRPIDVVREIPEAITQLPGKVAIGAERVGGYIGEKLGSIIGGYVGFTAGGLKARIQNKDVKQSINEAFSSAKKSAQETGQLGREVVGGGLAMFPRAIQTTIDISQIIPKVVIGKEDAFIDYVADNFVNQIGVDKQMAKNYLLTGNYEGDISKINKKEVVKAWYACLLPIGLDLWITSTLGTSALTNYYIKHPTKGYKPIKFTEVDFKTGIGKTVTKKGVENFTFTLDPSIRGKLRIVTGKSVGLRRMTEPITRGTMARQVSYQVIPEAITEAKEIPVTKPILPTRQVPAQISVPEARLQLPAGVLRPAIIPGATNVAFQMIESDTKTANSLLKKLENNLKVKQELLKAGRVNPVYIKMVNNTIERLKKDLEKVKRGRGIIGTGPEIQPAQRIVPKKIIEKKPEKITEYIKPKLTRTGSAQELYREQAIAARLKSNQVYTFRYQKVIDKYKADLQKVGLSKSAADWIQQYRQTRSGGIPSIEIQKELTKFKPDKPITIYRGLDLVMPKTFDKLKKEGYKTHWIDSWTYSETQAKKFAQSEHQIYGGGIGRVGRYQIIIKSTIEPKDILVDFTKLPKMSKIQYSEAEIKNAPEIIKKHFLENKNKPVAENVWKEVIIKPGTYKTKIIYKQKPLTKEEEAAAFEKIKPEKGISIVAEKKILPKEEQKVIRYSEKGLKNTNKYRGGTWYVTPESKSYDFEKDYIGFAGGPIKTEVNLNIKNPLVIKDAMMEDGSFAVINKGYENYLPVLERKLINEFYGKTKGAEDLPSDKNLKEIINDILIRNNTSKEIINELLKSNRQLLDTVNDLIISKGLKKKGYDALILENEYRGKILDKHIFKFSEGIKEVKTFTEELQKERAIKVKAKPIKPTPWKKARISKSEWEALEARKKIRIEGRKVKTYAERVKERAAELKKIDKQRIAAAKIRIAEARAKRIEEGISGVQLLREEKLLKGLQQFEDSTGRIINSQKAERLSKVEIKIQELNKQLKEAKAAGKNEAYFRDLDVRLFSEFLEGKSTIDKSEIVSKFIDDNFGIGKPEKYKPELLLSRIFFLPSEIANALDKTWQKIIGDKAYSGFQWLMNKLSEIKITLPSPKRVSIHYPFEYIFGTKQENLRPYNRQLQKGRAFVKSEILDLARDSAKLTPEEQSIVIKKIETMDYTNDKLGQEAKDLETKFVQIGYDLVKRGLMKEETFKEYLGRYFPRMYEAFDESNQIAHTMLRKRMSNMAYMKLKKDAYGVIYREGRHKIIKKFETRQERDQFIKDNLQGKKYDTFAPIKETKIAELKRIERLPYVVITRLKQEMMDVVIYDYLEAISKDKNLVSDTQDIDNGFVNKAPDTPTYGLLGGKYIHEWYYSNIRDFVELPTTLDRSLRLFNGLVKGFKTIVDPAVGFANAVSNLFLADMQGVPIERTDYWVRNLYNALTNKGAYKILNDEGATKQTYAIEEIEKFMRIDENQEEVKALLYNDSKLSTFDLMLTLYGLVKKGWIKAGNLYSFSEDWAKSVCFDWATNELGMSREQAIQFASDAIFNYSEISRGLRTLRRSFAGAAFPTFVAKIISQMIKTQLRKPFTIAKWHFILGTIAAASLTYYGITKEDIKRLKPEFIGSWFIVTDTKHDDKGNLIDIQLLDLSRYLPWGQITTMPLGISSPTDLIFHPEFLTRTQREKTTLLEGQNIFSAFMPLQLIIKPILELMLNHSAFMNKEIYPEDATTLEKMFAWEDHLVTSWLPSWTPSSVPGGKGGQLYQKLYSAFLQIPDFSGRVIPINEALLRIIGTKISHLRPEDQFSFLLSDISKDINRNESKIQSEIIRYDNAVQNREATSVSKNQAKLRYDEKIKLYEQKLQLLLDEYETVIDAQTQFIKSTKK